MNYNYLPNGAFSRPLPENYDPMKWVASLEEGHYFRHDRSIDDNISVKDIYGNSVLNGVLTILIDHGYYDNWKEKSASTNGTDKTYGDEYSVDKGTGADPMKYNG